MKRDIVLILLFDYDGRFLLQHRGNDAPTYPGYWGFFGGGIEDGETPLSAIRREAFEELRYVPVVEKPALIIEYRDEKTGRFGKKFYFAEICSDKSLLELHEGQAMGWFTIAEAGDLRITESNLRLIEKIIQHRFAGNA